MLSEYRDIEVLVTFFMDLITATKKDSPLQLKALEKIVSIASTSRHLSPSEETFRQTRIQFKACLDEVELQFKRTSLVELEWSNLERAFDKSKKRMRKCAKR